MMPQHTTQEIHHHSCPASAKLVTAIINITGFHGKGTHERSLTTRKGCYDPGSTMLTVSSPKCVLTHTHTHKVSAQSTTTHKVQTSCPLQLHKISSSKKSKVPTEAQQVNLKPFTPTKRHQQSSVRCARLEAEVLQSRTRLKQPHQQQTHNKENGKITN